MAGITVRMIADKQTSLQDIHSAVHQIDGAEEVTKLVQTVNDVIIWTMVYEKYYFRTGSYSNVTIVLTEFGEEQTASVIASAGGSGVENFSFGANRNLAKACVQALEACGFRVVESDLEPQKTGFFARLFE